MNIVEDIELLNIKGKISENITSNIFKCDYCTADRKLVLIFRFLFSYPVS